MKFALQVNGKIVRKWGWLIYPIGSVVVVMGSLAGVFFGGPRLWNRLTAQDKKVASQAEMLKVYQEKLAQLNGTNPEKLNADLKLLAEAVPFSSQVWEVVSQVKESALISGVQLIEWRATGGGVEGIGQKMTGLFDVERMGQLQKLIDELESRLPLVEIKRVVFVPGRTVLEVEGKWSSYARVTFEKENKLPEGVEAMLARLRAELAQFHKTLPGPQATGELGGRKNPF